jgi:hypothetical protein
VSLATDGALAQVPFGALPDAAGRYMVEDWTPVVWAWPAAMVERGARAKRGQGALVVKVAILYLSKTGKSVGLPVVAFTRWRTVELWTALAQ